MKNISKYAKTYFEAIRKDAKRSDFGSGINANQFQSTLWPIIAEYCHNRPIKICGFKQVKTHFKMEKNIYGSVIWLLSNRLKSRWSGWCWPSFKKQCVHMLSSHVTHCQRMPDISLVKQVPQEIECFIPAEELFITCLKKNIITINLKSFIGS